MTQQLPLRVFDTLPYMPRHPHHKSLVKWSFRRPDNPGWYHVGSYWETTAWRWWDGKLWSRELAYSHMPPKDAALKTHKYLSADAFVRWSDYWPKNPRTEDTRQLHLFGGFYDDFKQRCANSAIVHPAL